METVNNINARHVIPDEEYVNGDNSLTADQFTDYEVNNYEVNNSNYYKNTFDATNVNDAKLKDTNMFRKKGNIR